jgi:bifunctional DNA-binding transcriptional regulator/antitoxin component of YhaV-PrlF toxin-antitoxin module
LDINLFIYAGVINTEVVALLNQELGRSKISSRFQIVLPEGVRQHLKLHNLNPNSEYYVYFFKKNGSVNIKIAVVEKKEEVKFFEEQQ